MLAWCIGALIAIQGTIPAETTPTPLPPLPGHYVVDEAGLLDSASLATVDSIGRARAAIHLPLYVVTVPSVASHDSSGISFEAFSRRVFDAWSARRPGGDGAALLVVSAEDRLARIEVGSRWGHAHDAALRQVMTDAIEPAIARESLDQGIVLASYEITWALKPPEVSLWLRDALRAGAVILLGALVLLLLRRRRTLPTSTTAAVEEPRPAEEIDRTLRASQRMQAISDARQHSKRAAASIKWLDTGEVPRYDGNGTPDPVDAKDEEDR